MFASMASLTFLHLGNHPQLLSLPSFTGLASLKSMTLALLFNVQVLPSFEQQGQLQRLEIIGMTSLSSLPDMRPLRGLVRLTLLGRGQVCCNGFLVEACDLTHPLYAANPTMDLPMAICLQSGAVRVTPATFQRFESSVCGTGITQESFTVTKPMVDVYGGVMFRQCPADSFGTLGICINLRLGVLMCHHNNQTMNVRQAQIQRRIGTPCAKQRRPGLGVTDTVTHGYALVLGPSWRPRMPGGVAMAGAGWRTQRATACCGCCVR